ncbi:hypothetical protein [Oleidesulfovibrio sp.]|uniref:hypothetical protein n=1 Tax=Oleidesulfovibrio sp. TaxID=2909707 RepID=UPI003A85DDE2
MSMFNQLVDFFQPVTLPARNTKSSMYAVQLKLIDMGKIALLFAMSFVLYSGLSTLQ